MVYNPAVAAGAAAVAAAAAAGGVDDGEDDDAETDADVGDAAAAGLDDAAAAAARLRRSVLGTPRTQGRPRVAAAGGAVQFTWERGHLFDHLSAVVLYEGALEASVATVVDVTGNETSNMKPVPLNSVDFAMAASRHLRMNSQVAAKIAEDLYSQGYISYPRTETRECCSCCCCCAMGHVHASGMQCG